MFMDLGDVSLSLFLSLKAEHVWSETGQLPADAFTLR